jgi:hypothetical protein
MRIWWAGSSRYPCHNQTYPLPILATCRPSGFVFRRGRCRTAFRAGNAPAALLESWRARPSIECDAKPVFFAPNNPALPGDLIGLNDQLKFVGNAERTWNVKGGAEL